MQHAKTTKFELFNASKYKVGIVVAQFNADVTESMLGRAYGTLAEYKVAQKNITVIKVAGCVEAPVALQALARIKKYDCLVVLGCVIRGDTTHYDYVCKIVSEGMLRVSLDHSIAIGFGVLTVENYKQAVARLEVGASATEAALQTAYGFSQTK